MILEPNFTIRLPGEVVVHLQAKSGEELDYLLSKDGSVVLYRKKKEDLHTNV